MVALDRRDPERPRFHNLSSSLPLFPSRPRQLIRLSSVPRAVSRERKRERKRKKERIGSIAKEDGQRQRETYLDSSTLTRLELS